jgi:regulation of enolase protein 1 (concanavalin A-like superfamily)
VLEVRSPAPYKVSRSAATTSRLLRPVEAACGRSDFAAETVLIGATERGCHTAGLLLLASDEEYLYFGKGDLLVHEVRLEVCRHGQQQTIGRGWLPGPELHLRLERSGDRVTALCSDDGRQWQCCGETSFPVEGNLSIGLQAACPGILPGSLARFRGFQLFLPVGV